jgi:hypothetical protein
MSATLCFVQQPESTEHVTASQGTTDDDEPEPTDVCRLLRVVH